MTDTRHIVKSICFSTAQASSEASKRCKHLDDMCDDLEDFYEKLQELDAWLDQAIEQTDNLKNSKDGVDVQFASFKVGT